MLQIKQIRINKGYTQQEVADVLNISRVAYTNIENCKRDPDTGTLTMLADFFGVSLDAMFGRIPAATQLSSIHKQLDELFESVNADGQKAIIDYAVFISQKNEYKKVSVESAG